MVIDEGIIHELEGSTEEQGRKQAYNIINENKVKITKAIYDNKKNFSIQHI